MCAPDLDLDLGCLQLKGTVEFDHVTGELDGGLPHSRNR